MKTGQLLYLAKLSLKSTKKSNKIIIFMLAVSMIILIPVTVLWISVNVSVNKQINSMPYMLYSEAEIKDYRLEDEGANGGLDGKQQISEFEDIETKIVYERYYLTNAFAMVDVVVSLGGQEYALNKEERFYNVIDIDKSDNFFPKNLNSYGSVFADNCDKSFDGKGKKQVIVCEKLLDEIGVEKEDAYGKKITVSSSTPYYDGYLCYEYEIVGIIRKEVSAMYDGADTFMSALLFFCSSNVYDEKGEGVLKPVMTGNGYEYGFVNIDKKDVLNKEYMMIGLGSTSYEIDSFASTHNFIESSSYKKLAQINDSLIHKAISLDTSQLFAKYKQLYDISNVLTFIFASAGTVLLIITIMYYYLNIKHDIEKRKNFLTVMRAVGAHDKDIPKVYMMQSNIICAIASLIFLVIGLALCISIKYAVAAIMKVSGISVAISVSWPMIFISLFGMIAIMFAITNIIALVCTVRLSKQSIIEILHKEQ